MAVTVGTERMERNFAICRRRQVCAETRIIRGEERVDAIEITEESTRINRRVVGKQRADLARVDRMAARDDGSSSRELRQLESRHQLDRRARMPPRNRRQRR